MQQTSFNPSSNEKFAIAQLEWRLEVDGKIGLMHVRDVGMEHAIRPRRMHELLRFYFKKKWMEEDLATWFKAHKVEE